MIYLDNNQSLQDLFIPRQSAKAVSGSTDWASREYVNDLMNAETARTEDTYAKKEELSAYTPTTGFTTINGHPITDGGDIVIEGTEYRGGDNIEISANTISVTGIPTTFKTINGSAITGNGDITIEGKVYSAGTNISIDENDVISVTGITVPTKVSELQNDAGYLTEHQSLSAYSTTEQVEGMITAATSSLTSTQDVENMVSAATAATTGWVENQHYLTEHQSLTAYTPTSGFSTVNGSAITHGGDITIDSSATVELTQAEYDALETKEEGTIYVITDAPTIDIDDLASKRLEVLDEFPSSPVDGDVINLEDGLWKYKENPVWGTWVGTRQQGVAIGGNNESATELLYDYLPSAINGSMLCELRYYSSNYGGSKYLFVDLDNNRLLTFTTSGAVIDVDTPSDTISPNEDKNISGFGIGSTRIKWDSSNKRIIFYQSSYNITVNPISTTLSGYGWEKVVKNTNYEFPTDSITINGWPRWDKSGRIVGKESDVSTTQIKINTTGYNRYLTVVQKGANNVPGSLYMPTSGGTAGQILTSNGDDAPVWQTMIKAVKISSSDYDALVQAGTTDENTLYLIVDE